MLELVAGSNVRTRIDDLTSPLEDAGRRCLPDHQRAELAGEHRPSDLCLYRGQQDLGIGVHGDRWSGQLPEALKARSGQQIAALDQEKETAGLAERRVREMAIERIAAQQMAKAAEEMAAAKARYRDLGGPGLER